MLQEDIEDDLCSDDPWLVLHKIDSPTKMRFVGNKVAQCDPSTLNSTTVAPSIARYVGAEGDNPTLRSSVCMEKRKDYAFRRQFSEKLSMIPSYPGFISV